MLLWLSSLRWVHDFFHFHRWRTVGRGLSIGRQRLEGRSAEVLVQREFNSTCGVPCNFFDAMDRYSQRSSPIGSCEEIGKRSNTKVSIPSATGLQVIT
jgi:hypothetical protein